MGNGDSKPAEGEALYAIVVKTSSMFSNSETVNSIYIQLVGEKETTDWVKLKGLNLSQYLGKDDQFTIVTKDVGSPVLLNIKLHCLHLKDEWYPDYVIISSNDGPVVFPIYDWVTEHISVPRGQACLPQNVTHKAVKAARESEIDKNKKLFSWKPKSEMLSGFPRYPDELAQLFGRSSDRLSDILSVTLQTYYAKFMEKFENYNNNLDSFDDYMNLYEHYESDGHKFTPNYIKDWESDVTMGRQVLTGITPTSFSRCREIPSYFDVTHDDVAELLGEGNCLSTEMKDGKIYICDFYELLKDLKRNEGKAVCANVVGLFYMNCDDDFVPIAIQLVPGDRDYLFTPKDSRYDWLLAKMHFRCALTNIHEWAVHLCLTHLICEPFANSVFRCFPRSHPLYKLLRPHLRTVFAINENAKQLLIGPNGYGSSLPINAEDMIRKTFNSLHIEDLVLPKLLKKLGIDNACLKKYYYRQDALKIWNALETYVTRVLKHYYNYDKCVENDYELQHWCREMAEEGLGWEDGNSRGMPECLVSLDQLIEICTSVIFTSSAQHAAVNFGQLDTYQFIPNCPVLRQPPHKKGEGSKELIFKSLPKLDASLASIGMAAILSTFTENEIYLGNYPDRLFSENAILDFQKEFAKDLLQIKCEIIERNESLEVPYIYLLPDSIPNSVAI